MKLQLPLSVKKQQNFLDLNYGLSDQNGFESYFFRDRAFKLVGKVGLFPGFASWFLCDPEAQTAVAVLTNLETKVMESMQLAIRIFEEKRRMEQVKPERAGTPEKIPDNRSSARQDMGVPQ